MLVLLLDTPERISGGAGGESGVLYRYFVSADLNIIEGPGGIHVAGREDVELGGDDVGVVVTCEGNLVRHISICSSLGDILQNVCEMWRRCILQRGSGG